MGNTLLHVKAEFSVCALFAALDSQEARLVIPTKLWGTEVMTLALARYLDQERVSNPLLLGRIAEIEPAIVCKASRAATSLGMPISRACQWLDVEGVPYGKRARVSSVKRARIAALLQDGVDYQRVADEVGVKKSLVRAFAAANPELKSVWQQRRFEDAREHHRARAAELFVTHRGVSIKVLKAVPGNGLAWLERHDRGWLIENAPDLFSPK